jgi:hypothetical protein
MRSIINIRKMVSMTRQSKGFSAIELVIVLVVVLAAGFGGWYVWHKNHTSVPAKQSSSTNQAKSTQSNQTNTQSDPTEGGKYVVIKEWGVRFLLPQDLRGDVEYGIRKNVLLNDHAPDGTPPVYGDVAYFASKKLDSIPAQQNNCALKPGGHDDLNQRDDPTSYDGGPGISLARSTDREKPSSTFDYHAGNYWYRISKGSAPMCYTGSDGSQETQFISMTIDALKTVEVVPTN